MCKYPVLILGNFIACDSSRSLLVNNCFRVRKNQNSILFKQIAYCKSNFCQATYSSIKLKHILPSNSLTHVSKVLIRSGLLNSIDHSSGFKYIGLSIFILDNDLILFQVSNLPKHTQVYIESICTQIKHRAYVQINTSNYRNMIGTVSHFFFSLEEMTRRLSAVRTNRLFFLCSILIICIACLRTTCN